MSSWAPEHIHVERQFGDGLSGALAIGLLVDPDDARTRHVAKLAPADEAHAELKAFRDIFAHLPHTLFAPIRTATEGAFAPDPAQSLEPEAVVYVDVATWAGCEPDEEVVSLEQLVERALVADGSADEVERAVDLLGRLLDSAALALYQGARPLVHRGDRMAAKKSFGPDLRLMVNDVDANGQPVYGGTDPQVGERRLWPLDVVRAGLNPSGSGSGCADSAEETLPLGQLVTLSLPEGLEATGEGFLIRRDGAVVVVDFEAGCPSGKLRAVDPAKVRYVRGKVVDTRPRRTWQRISEALGMVPDAPDTVRVKGTRVRHPFAMLDHIVRERTAATLVGVVHGDLNHRNVLFCKDQPFLIDYARGLRGKPVLDDLAWLELNMLRQPLADGLTFDDLVAVQRLLLLGDVVADLLPPMPEVTAGPDRRSALDTCLTDLVAHRGQRVVTVMRLLCVLRARVQRICAGKDTGQPWWSEYQVALLLAAHRAFKWSDEMQTTACWRAQVASACVATEALHVDGPFLGLWEHDELAAAAAALLPLLPAVPDPGAVHLLAAVVAGLGAAGPAEGHGRRPGGPDDPASHIAHVLRTCRTRVARATAGPAAHRRLRELHRERQLHTPFIDLSAETAGPVGPTGPAPGHGPRTWVSVPSAVDELPTVPRALLLGGVGSGRATLLDEVERRRLSALLPEESASSRTVQALFPVRLSMDEIGRCSDAASVGQAVRTALAAVAPAADDTALLRAGMVHLLVDLPGGEDTDAAAALRAFAAKWPAMSLTSTAQGREPSAGYAAWRAVRMLGPRPEQAARYLAHRSAQRGLGSVHAAELTDLALSAPWAELLQEGRCSPLLLSRLARLPVGGPPRRRPSNEQEVLDAYFTEVTADWPGAALRYAEDRAAYLTDPQEAPHGGNEPEADLRPSLVRSEVFTVGGTFHRIEEQDYFASRWLRARSQDDPLLRRLVLRHAWYGAFRCLSALTPSPTQLLGRLVDDLTAADPVQAATLLRAPLHPPQSLVAPFLRAQAAVLRDGRAGPAEHAAAADALAAFAAPTAYGHLLAVLSETPSPPAARAACLKALVAAARTARRAAHGRRVSEELARRLAPLLAPDTPQELSVAALHAVEALKLHGLALITADLVRPGVPWPVVRAALAALDALGMRLSPALSEARHSAVREGVSYVERALEGPVSGAEASALAVERARLVQSLPGREGVAALLERRFAPGIGGLARELLEEYVRGVPRPEPATSYENLLWDGENPGTAYSALVAGVKAAEPDPENGMRVTAALHRLLHDAPERAADAFTLLSLLDTVDGVRLSERIAAVAATVRHLPAELLPSAGRFAATAIQAVVRDPRCPLDGAAALVDAVSARDRAAGFRLAREAHRRFAAAGLRGRFGGAWAATLARGATDASVVDALLSSGDTVDRDLALDAVADHGFLLLAGPAPTRSCGVAVGDDVLARLGTADADAAPRLVRAAAALGLVGALPVLCHMIARRDGADTAEPVTLGAFGVCEVSPFADLIAATGFLAARAGASHPDAVHAYQTVRELDTSGAHPSVAVGRLIALGLSGDWPPVLDALPGEDARLPVIARNVLAHWLPGPFTPASADASAAARQLTDRLATNDGLTPEARSHLYDLRLTLERRIGAATPPSDGRGGLHPGRQTPL